MAEFDDSAMIALLPINASWSNVELPHLTLVYAGLVQDLRPNAFNEMAKDATSLSMMSNVITLRVMGLDIFGDEEKVDVLRLRNTPELMAMRHVVERWNASEHPFNPHVTIGPAGELPPGEMPAYVAFNRVIVSYGPENLTFNLK